MKFARAAAALCFIFLALLLLHASLLHLPYFWDEAGYYIPAARDFYLHHQLIPTSTLTNAHPPLPSIYLAGAWWIFGYSPLVTRVAMLLVAAFALCAVFRIARTLQNTQVAWATVACTALYPVWFAQSSLAHADLLAACFTLWGLAAYFAQQSRLCHPERGAGAPNHSACHPERVAYLATNRRTLVLLFFTLAALSKETALLFPLTLAIYEQLARPRRRLGHSLALLLPALPLAAWYLYHRARTGYLFGNPEFVRYNVSGTLSLGRFFAALLKRGWYLFGHMDLYVLVILALIALAWPPVRDKSVLRPRIALSAQFAIAALVLANWLAFSIIGGAVLTRYTLPIFPLIILILVSTLWRRFVYWQIPLAVVLLGFVLMLVRNPNYGYAPEDNLAYADFVRLHQNATHYIAAELPHSVVLTAWPGSSELDDPWLGYIDHPVRTVSIDNFTLEQITSAAQKSGAYEAAFVFSTKYEPSRPLLLAPRAWMQNDRQYFGFHTDLPPEAIAQLLGGRIVWQQHRGALWAAVIVFDRSFVG